MNEKTHARLYELIHTREVAAYRLKELYSRRAEGLQVIKAEAAVDRWTRAIRRITEPAIRTKYMDYDTA